MAMVVSFYFLGVYNMADGLRHISTILTELELITKELKLHNDRMDAKYGQSNVLSTSDAGTGTIGTSNNGCCGGCEKQSNTKLGE